MICKIAIIPQCRRLKTFFDIRRFVQIGQFSEAREWLLWHLTPLFESTICKEKQFETTNAKSGSFSHPQNGDLNFLGFNFKKHYLK